MRKGPAEDRDYLAQMGYERRDISVPSLIKSIIALFVFLGAASVAGGLMYVAIVPREAGVETVKGPIVGENRKLPEPFVQPDPVTDIHTFRRAEEQVLNNYAWKDKAKGIVQLPVERAIELTAQRGLPAPGGK